MAGLSFTRERLSQSRAELARHRQTKHEWECTGSRESRLALDWTNFFMADAQTGFGAFVAFYLAGLGWTQENAGLALTAGRIAGAIALVPGGAITDAIRWKRGYAAAGILMIACAALILALWPAVIPVFAAEALHGLSGAVAGPAIAAISLGIVGRERLSVRIGRNNRFMAAGNAITALLLGVLGSYISKSAIFLATAVLTIPALISLSFVRSSEIGYARARNARKEEERPSLGNAWALIRNTQLFWFAGCLAMFQLADASLLLLASEHLGSGKGTLTSLMESGLIVAPEIAVAVLAPWVGYFSELWGRKPLLLAGFVALILRAILYAFISAPLFLIAIQLLDGISGATISVLTVVVVGDLTAGTGRFNLARGAVGLVSTIGASVSTAVSGFIAQEVGRPAAFFSMGGLAAGGAVLLWLALKESKPDKYS